LIWVRIFCPELAKRAGYIQGLLAAILPDHEVYVAFRTVGETDQKKSFGWLLPKLSANPKALVAQENLCRFVIMRDPASDFGIYTDARRARLWLSQTAKGKSVLNLYSYTCAFGVAAAKAGAADVVNVDLSREYLMVGKENARLNGCDFAVVPEDCSRYLKRTKARIERGAHKPPDVLVIDPPAFLQGRGAARLNRNVLPELLQSSFAILPPGGSLLVSCNDRYLGAQDGERFLRLLGAAAHAGMRKIKLEVLQQTPDVLGRDPQDHDAFYVPPRFWSVGV
jgi:23S rRNA G2069 N7-methylase RlmK/C1962 C5-methylase RlmI